MMYAVQMQLARILLEISNVLVILDSEETGSTVSVNLCSLFLSV